LYVEKYSARHCLRHNLAVHYAANNSVQHTPNAKHRRKHLREFARQAQKIYLFIYTHRIKSHRADRKIGSVQVQGSLPCSGGSKGG
jgi:hypothetical protein